MGREVVQVKEVIQIRKVRVVIVASIGYLLHVYMGVMGIHHPQEIT